MSPSSLADTSQLASRAFSCCIPLSGCWGEEQLGQSWESSVPVYIYFLLSSAVISEGGKNNRDLKGIEVCVGVCVY
jgi:hypothetical protein